MTIGAIYDRMKDELKAVYDDREAVSVTGLVLESRLGIRRIDRILRKTESLGPAQEAQLQSDLDALLQNKPVQYVLGEAWFDGLLLRVNEHVLIPRPETEELVHWIVDDQNTIGYNTGQNAGHNPADPVPGPVQRPYPWILDIGTGSGCIPIALKKHLPKASLHAFDISEAALTIAKENADLQHTDIGFFEADILSKSGWQNLPQYDIVVSNPPYIALAEKSGMHSRVLDNEPSLALFVPDADPLLFYRKIARFCNIHLSSGGILYLEINEALGEETKKCLSEEGFIDMVLKKDLQGKDRIIRARRRSPDIIH